MARECVRSPVQWRSSTWKVGVTLVSSVAQGRSAAGVSPVDEYPDRVGGRREAAKGDDIAIATPCAVKARLPAHSGEFAFLWVSRGGPSREGRAACKMVILARYSPSKFCVEIDVCRIDTITSGLRRLERCRRNAIIKTFLRWGGNKGLLIDTCKSHFWKHDGECAKWRQFFFLSSEV